MAIGDPAFFKMSEECGVCELLSQVGFCDFEGAHVSLPHGSPSIILCVVGFGNGVSW